MPHPARTYKMADVAAKVVQEEEQPAKKVAVVGGGLVRLSKNPSKR